jgi:hypothetical protein
MPLSNGRWSACRVLDVRGARGLLVEGLDWNDVAPPTLEDVRKARPLALNRHAGPAKPCRDFVRGAPPRSFRLLGVLTPSPRERATECWSWGRWEFFALQALLEWRWKHDRKALLAEEARRTAAQAARDAEAETKRRTRLAGQTLEGLSRRRFFSSWSRPPAHPSPELTRASRALLREAVERLLGLGPGARQTSKIKILRDCVEAFNRLDEENDHFIETDEREDICEQLEEIAYACGLGHRVTEAYEGRDW